MNAKNIEISIVVVIFLFLLGLLAFRRLKKNDSTYHITITLFILIEAFIIIHFLFCYQIGFPASVMQNNHTDLILSASDWLNFLSGYLGFAGSLIMAYLVYHQSEAINKLTASEYLVSVSLEVQDCVKSVDCDNFCGKRILQPISKNSAEKYYTFHCRRENDTVTDYEDFDVLIFTELVNNSKSTIKKLSFSGIEIREIDGGKSYSFYNCFGKLDPADKTTEIYPGKKLKRCFMIENIPCNINLSWMTIYFTYDGTKELPLKVLIQKAKGEIINFHSISQ